MDAQKFWDKIEEAKVACAGGGQEEVEFLTSWLTRQPEAEIIDFHKLFTDFRLQLEQNLPLRQALRGGRLYMSDDGYTYFCAWVVGQGKEAFDLALSKPYEFLEVIGREECEELLYVADVAYERRTGREMP